MAAPARLAPLALAAFAAACAPPAARCPASPPSVAAAPCAPPAPVAGRPAPPTGPRLTITLTPILSAAPAASPSGDAPIPPEAAVEVEIIAAAGAPGALSRWSMAAAAPGAIRIESASDESGPIAAELTAAPPALRLRFARPPKGAVRLHYVARAAPFSGGTSPAVEADPDRFRAAGEALLALPDALDDKAVPVSLHIRPGALGADSVGRGAASSFGAGADREIVARGRDLRFGTYLAGPLGTAVFEAPEGHDEAAWLGYTTFDPRPVAADLAAFRTAVRQLFRDRTSPPLTLLLMTDARPAGSFVASRRASSVLLQIGVQEPWSGPLRIAAATEILRGWVGEQLWIGPAEPGREAEAYWFTEGVARNLARDLLFRFGLLSPAEVLEEMHGLSAVVATSPHRGRDNQDLAAHAREPGVLPLLVARGALYAARTDALLRRRGAVKPPAAAPPAAAPPAAAPPAAAAEAPAARSLDDVIRALLADAHGRRGPLPTSAWLDALSAALGPGEAAAFRDHIERGLPAALPEGALGPCFRGARRRYEPFDLGFDLDATRADPARALAGLRAAGPAARAGARAGDLLAEIEVTRGRADVPVKLAVQRAGKRVVLTYRPAGPAGDGQGWTRVAGVADDACAH